MLYLYSTYTTWDVYDMIYLTANGLPPAGSSTVHIYTQTIHRTTHDKVSLSKEHQTHTHTHTHTHKHTDGLQ